ncbi:uncharacterized protein OCT59_009850 [Rhizophagus irregularis]|uniref:uncharacterized protein n=1 Tax=Rhizophagus irregularis TaxID=588596 RepID=UPI00332A3DFA|nr:hypothetical protein OCT59_009850 [Rhizophagus irregularis]
MMRDCALEKNNLLFITEPDAAFSESFGKVKVRRLILCLDKILVPLARQQHNHEHKAVTERRESGNEYENLKYRSTKEAGVEMFSWFLPKRLRIYYRTS